MGKIRFRKTKSIGPLKFTVTPKGIGTSVGVKGARIGRGSDGKTRISASIPGSGLSYQHTVGSGKRQQATQQHATSRPAPRRGIPWWAWALIIFFGLPLVVGILGAF